MCIIGGIGRQSADAVSADLRLTVDRHLANSRFCATKDLCRIGRNVISIRRLKPSQVIYIYVYGQTDSQVYWQVHASRKRPKFHAYPDDLRSTCVVRQTVETCIEVAYEFELDQIRVLM